MPGNKRNPGGQPGNRNAFKHGLYAKHLTADELTLLALDHDLANEIIILRAIIGRIAEALKDKEIGEKEITLIQTLAICAANVGTLTIKRAFDTGKGADVQNAIAQAILDLGPLVFPNLLGKK